MTTTGVDAIDLWIGGLAEKQMPFGGLLGSTFNFVFETQMENLQNGDRFYYLSRLAGLNFLTEMENNSFAKLVMLNTDTTHLPADIFSTPGFILEVNQANQFTPVWAPTATTIRSATAPTSLRWSFATTPVRRAPIRTTSSTPAATMSSSAAPPATTS